ncbi:MAG: hypothetical protein KAR23_03615, partial [Candidatus Aenigmarchaeota archaeon]|nr:hypothetical protein [Candidatus Aenigmarchaeota archaeon]
FEFMFEGYQYSTDYHDIEIYNYDTGVWDMLLEAIPTVESTSLTYIDLTVNFTYYVDINGIILVRYIHDSASAFNHPSYLVYIDYQSFKLTQDQNSSPLYGNNYPQNITLTYPSNDSTVWKHSFEFLYNVSDADNEIANCSLIINGTVNQTNSSITKDTTLSFSIWLDNGSHSYSINCTDVEVPSQTYGSGTYYFDVNTTNIAPWLTQNISDMYININSSKTLDLDDYFEEPNGDDLTFSYYSVANITIMINETTNVVNITPDAGFSGTGHIVFIANDSVYTTDSNNFTFGVGTKTINVSPWTFYPLEAVDISLDNVSEQYNFIILRPDGLQITVNG